MRSVDAIPALPCVANGFFVTLWAKPIVPLLYGAGFAPSVVALQILIWAAAIMYVSMVSGNAFVAANLQRFYMRLTLVDDRR